MDEHGEPIATPTTRSPTESNALPESEPGCGARVEELQTNRGHTQTTWKSPGSDGFIACHPQSGLRYITADCFSDEATCTKFTTHIGLTTE